MYRPSFNLLILFCLLGCDSLNPFSSSDGKPRVRQDVLKPVNEARTKGHQCGDTYYAPAGRLVWNNKLADAALRHSIDMAQNGTLGHIGSDGSLPGDRIKKTGYVAITWGENVAAGSSSIEEVMNAWLASEGHCKNLMNPSFNEMGAASAEGTKKEARYYGRLYWTLVLAKTNSTTGQ